LSKKLEAYEFVSYYVDYSLFTYKKGNIFLGLLMYVDDIIPAGNDTLACQQFQEYLNIAFGLRILAP